MKLRILAVFAVACVCFFSPAMAQAGPVRNLWDNRPGILIPKRGACCQSCAPSQPAAAPVQQVQYLPAPVYALPSAPASGGCVGGNCPVPTTTRRGLFGR